MHISLPVFLSFLGFALTLVIVFIAALWATSGRK